MKRELTSSFSVALARKRLKLAQVSRDTGISRTTLTKLYYDKNPRISISTLEKLCNYLDCALEDILSVERREV